jgi:predicted nucleic acid-binding Zn ribbon protein
VATDAAHMLLVSISTNSLGVMEGHLRWNQVPQLRKCPFCADMPRVVLAARVSRGKELRRKILAGAVLLANVEAGEFEETTLKQWMRTALTREEDRPCLDWRCETRW